MTTKSDNPNKTSNKRGKQDPRQDPTVNIPRCPECHKDALSCTCGGFEDLKK